VKGFSGLPRDISSCEPLPDHGGRRVRGNDAVDSASLQLMTFQLGC